MSELTPLREAIDTLAGRTSPPDFGELQRRATRRGRRRVVLVAAATAAVIVGSVLASIGPGGERRSIPVEQPSPSADAAQIIAEGHLYGYDAHRSGAVLTVWTTCENELDTRCGHAWRLGTGARPLATGILSEAKTHAYVTVDAGEDGFVLTDPFPIGVHRVLRVGLDGTVTLARCRDHNPPVEPGRLVWHGIVLDRAGVFCPTRFGGGDEPDDGLVARPLSGSGAFTADGRLWALVSNEDAPPTQTIGMFDGTRWHYRDLAPQGQAFDGVVAAGGSNVVVLSQGGLSATTDNGATWREVTDRRVLERDLPFLADGPAAGCCSISAAFAGSSTLYVADARGGLWRSTDLTTFHQTEAPGVYGLKSAGDDVLALVKDSDELVRIAADGRVERLVVR